MQRCKIRETNLYSSERALTLLIPWSSQSSESHTFSASQQKYCSILWQRTVHYRVQRISDSSLTRARSSQFALSYPVSSRPTFLLSSHVLGVDTSGFPTKNPTFISLLSHAFHMIPSNSSFIWWPEKYMLRSTNVLSYGAQKYWPHRNKSCCDFLDGCKYLPFKSLFPSCCLALVPLVRTGQ